MRTYVPSERPVIILKMTISNLPLDRLCPSSPSAPTGDLVPRLEQPRLDELAADREARRRSFVESLPREVLLMAARQEFERAMAERDALARQSRVRTARRLKARALSPPR